VTIPGLGGQEPFEHAQPVAEQPVISEVVAGHEMTASATAALAWLGLGAGHGHAASAAGSPMAMLAR
jgi:hypothetical protein